jgi:hypothetical protein
MTQKKTRQRRRETLGNGKKEWTTDAQKAWLLDRKPAFLVAQEGGEKKLEAFWTSIKEDWFATWPLPELTEEEKQAGMTEKKQLAPAMLVSRHLLRQVELKKNFLDQSDSSSGTITIQGQIHLLRGAAV